MDKNDLILTYTIELLRDLRVKKKISQREVGEYLNTSSVYVSRLENNMYSKISMSTLMSMCDLFDVKLYDILKQAEERFISENKILTLKYAICMFFIYY